MGRKKTDTETLKVKVTPEDRVKLAGLAISLGFKYKREAAIQPNWVEFYAYLASRTNALKNVLPNLAKDLDDE